MPVSHGSMLPIDGSRVPYAQCVKTKPPTPPWNVVVFRTGILHPHGPLPLTTIRRSHPHGPLGRYQKQDVSPRVYVWEFLNRIVGGWSLGGAFGDIFHPRGPVCGQQFVWKHGGFDMSSKLAESYGTFKRWLGDSVDGSEILHHLGCMKPYK